MIRDYADFDSKSPGCYGYHPLLDISRTCFSKVSCFFQTYLSYILFVFYYFLFSLLCNKIFFFIGS